MNTELNQNSPERKTHEEQDLTHLALPPVSQKDGRTRYLEKAANGELSPVIILSGHSGAGKTAVIRMLGKIGVEQAVRFLPRPKRADDSEHDKVWNREGADKVLFAYKKYEGLYGIPLADLIKKSKTSGACAIIAGDLGKITPLSEACRTALPLVPIVPIRLDVPFNAIRRRLTRLRSEAYPGESRSRLDKLRSLESQEQKQHPYLTSLYKLRTIFNLTKAEHRSLGFHPKQLKWISEGTLASVMKGFVKSASEDSAKYATDLLRPRELSLLNCSVPAAVHSAVDRLIDSCGKAGFTPVLKGGLAVSAYVPNLRPVSPDVDFTIAYSLQAVARMKSAIRELTGKDLEFRDFTQKAVFHSSKINCFITEGAEPVPVEIDAVAVTRIQPPGSLCSFDFRLDSCLNFYRREVRLENGKKAWLAPPETIIIEKLAAGRGRKDGKYDLTDAAALISAFRTDLNLMQRMIEMQKFDPAADAALGEVIVAGLGSGKSGAEVFSPFLKSRRVKTWLAERTESGSPIDFTVPCTAKKLLLLDRCMSGLSRIAEENRSAEFPDKQLQNNLLHLRKYIKYHVKYQLGRDDIYIKRIPYRLESDQDFSGAVESQRQRLM